MSKVFNEDTRVKIPATIQFLRIGYHYQSLNNADIDFETKIFINRFKPALEKINGRSFSDGVIKDILMEINSVIKNNDLGKEISKIFQIMILLLLMNFLSVLQKVQKRVLSDQI